MPTVKFGSGAVSVSGVLNGPDSIFGVAVRAFLGGACRLNGLFGDLGEALANVDGGSVLGVKVGASEMSSSDLYAEGGNLGDMAYCEKAGDLGPNPGVLGADWERS